uniref:BRICHOS domain-containing protein n=1 Tax=Panagrellus redivivus TaxID=6233 RepID=A0A7E4W5T4_PANRE
MDPRRHIEQIEVIEHHITEGRRPISSDHLEFIPTSEYKTTTENFVTTTSALPFIESDTRYHLTGERDFSREPSFLHQSAGGLRDLPPVQHSTPERNSSSGINNYGYDVHEVHTSGGGARIVQSHGSGFVDASPLQPQSSLVMHDRSMETVHNQSGSRGKEVGFSGNLSGGSQAEHLHSILKTTPDETWRRFGSSEENSLARKDSYKKMQDQAENVSVYAPSSQATMITKGSKDKWTFGNNQSQKDDDGNGCWSRVKQAFVKLINQIHDTEWNPRKICAIISLLLCLLLLFLVLWLIVSSFFAPYSTRKLWMYPPYCEECLKKNPALGTYRPPSKLYVHYYSPAQAHFEIVGNPPLKSNSFTAVDFDTGFVAIADHALTNRHGQHTTCFLMELDRAALPSMEVLREGLAQSYDEVKTQYGWQEYWQYVPEVIDANQAELKFKDKIPDCQNVKWYFLKHSVYTRDSSCTDCYDFCLPDYAVQRREKYDDHMTLGIRRLNCFRIYVPEWNRFQLKADDSGGHWEYPVHPQYTQRDSDGEWTNWNPTAFIQQPQGL